MNVATKEVLRAQPGHDSAPQVPMLNKLGAGFDRDSFREFVHARFGHGDGQVVYMYGTGNCLDWPDGRPFCRMQGMDLGHLVEFDIERGWSRALARKVLVYRDYENGDILYGKDGKPLVEDLFTYQDFRFYLEGDQMLYKVTQGPKPFVFEACGGETNEVRKVGDMTYFSTPVSIAMGPMKAWENYDFILHPEGSPGPRLQCTWGRYSNKPIWAGRGFCTMNMTAAVYDNYEDMPPDFRVDFLEKYAPMWMHPPKDDAEIAEMQKFDLGTTIKMFGDLFKMM